MAVLNSLEVEVRRPVGLEANHPYLQLLGIEPRSTVQLIMALQEGLTTQEFTQFSRNIGLSSNALASFMKASNRTLHRRKSAAGRLDTSSSEALVRLARVFGASIELFEGDASKARHWMKTPRAALSGMTPLEMSSTEVGAREVEALIDRLEEGVFS